MSRWQVVLALACVLGVCSVRGQLSLDLNTTNGDYSISFGGKAWLQSAEYGLRLKSKVLTSRDGSLKLARTFTDHSSDFIGEYSSTSIMWNDSDSNVYATELRPYTRGDVIVFEQILVAGLSDSASGDNNDIVTAFPTFNESKSDQGLLNYLTYADTFCYGRMGAWGSKSFGGGHSYGPLVLYDDSLNTIVISSLNNFMTAVPARSKTFGGAVGFGFQGKIDSAPEGYVYATIMVAGQGIKSTMAKWGQILLQLGGKVPSNLHSDPSISHLGYYTDNGAYYYYRTEPKKNYQQTMLDVKAAAMKLDIPFTYFQFDSWWYYKDRGSAVTLWEPRPDVFPDGMSQWLDLPLVLHNRWWSPHNNYTAAWFIAEERCALPKDEALFDLIMGKAKKWGMIVYEQDWLVTTYERMNATQATLDDAANWLRIMGSAASKLNISVQYCMALPMHMLQSTSIQAVTQARASGDYHPGNTNWNVGLTSLFYWSIGVVPFKDDFFTYNGTEEGCPYGTKGCVEPNFVLETLVAALSAGPVGPSDGVEYLNKELIMRTCRTDGLLLKPDEPAIFHDASFKLGFKDQARYEIWHTMSNISLGITHYVLAMDLEQGAAITISDLGAPADAQFIAYDYFASCPLGQEKCAFTAETMQRVNSSSPLNLRATKTEAKRLGKGEVSFQYWVVAQTWPNGWTPLGEGHKLVPMSRQRITSLAGATGQPFQGVLSGVEGEEATLWAVLPSGEIGPANFKFPASGQVAFSCTGHSTSDVKCTTE